MQVSASIGILFQLPANFDSSHARRLRRPPSTVSPLHQALFYLFSPSLLGSIAWNFLNRARSQHDGAAALRHRWRTIIKSTRTCQHVSDAAIQTWR